MKVLLTSLCVAAAPLLTSGGSASAAEPETYLFDVLRHPQYKAALKQVVKGKDLPGWVQAFMERGDGVVAPMKSVEVAGHPYRLDHLCKPHDCPGNVLSVLWSPGGRKVWAALVNQGGAPTLLGGPSPDKAQVLTADATGG